MPESVTVVHTGRQITPLGALATILGDDRQRSDDDQEAQSKIAQHQADQQAAYNQQIALHLIGEAGKSGGMDAINQLLVDNPQIGHYVLRPDSSSDAMMHKELARIWSTPDDDQEAIAKGMKPLTAAQKMGKAKSMFDLKESADKVIAAGVLGGDANAQRAASNEAGITMTAGQTATEDERKRHNIVGETQLAPVRKSETYKNTQAGDSSKASAENTIMRRDINSPLTQTEITKATVEAQGRATVAANTPSKKPVVTPQQKQVNDFLKRAQDLEDSASRQRSTSVASGMKDQAAKLRGRAENIRRSFSISAPVSATPNDPAPVTPAPSKHFVFDPATGTSKPVASLGEIPGLSLPPAGSDDDAPDDEGMG